MEENSHAKTPRRQARGLKRIAQIMRAAGEVFGEAGYENATTNAIAARAGVSPGTLYQFFRNKQAIAEALANDYAARNLAAHQSVGQVDVAGLPLRDLIDRLVDPFLEFRRTAPGFEALFTGSVVSPELAQRIQTLHQQLTEQIAAVVRIRAPHLPPDQVHACAETSVQIVKGLLPLALRGTARQRETGTQELKLVLARYLAPVDEKRQAQPRRSREAHRS